MVNFLIHLRNVFKKIASFFTLYRRFFGYRETGNFYQAFVPDSVFGKLSKSDVTRFLSSFTTWPRVFYFWSRTTSFGPPSKKFSTEKIRTRGEKLLGTRYATDWRTPHGFAQTENILVLEGTFRTVFLASFNQDITWRILIKRKILTDYIRYIRRVLPLFIWVIFVLPE